MQRRYERRGGRKEEGREGSGQKGKGRGESGLCSINIELL